MRHYKLLLTSFFASMLLTACVSEEQVDAKLQAGCVTAINTLIEPAKVQEVLSANLETILEVNGLFRKVELHLLEADGWTEEERKYSCVFNENWGFAKMSHTAHLTEVDVQTQHLGVNADQESKDGVSFQDIATQVHDAMTRTSY